MRTAALLLFAALTASACQKKPDAPGGGASVSDHDRLQGVWMIESADDGSQSNAPPPDDMKDDRLQFEGDHLTIVGPRDRVRFSFALETSSDPKAIVLTELGDDGRPQSEKSEWIYKFDGDVLVVAVPREAGGRPTEFRTRSGSSEQPGRPREIGCTAMRLRKADEKPADVPPPRRGSAK